MNSVKWPCSLWVFIDHWIGCLPSVQEVMGLIPFGDSDFFLSHARAMLISSLISFQNHNTPLSSFMSVFELKSNLSQTLANPITKDKDNPELRVIRCSWCKVSETCERVAIGFGFISYWMKNGVAFLTNQSWSIVCNAKLITLRQSFTSKNLSIGKQSLW